LILFDYSLEVALLLIDVALPDTDFVVAVKRKSQRVSKHVAHVEHDVAAEFATCLERRLAQPNLESVMLGINHFCSLFN
jgi:hypothetical protein